MADKVKRGLKRSKYLPHSFAAALSIIIIGVIVFAPAASALTVEILGAANNQKVGQSGTFKFVAHIQITSGELIPLQTLNIILNGETFSFDPRTGEPIGPTSPAIVSVNPTNFPVGQPGTPPYGYTYGYFLGLNDSQRSYGYPYAYGYGVVGPRTINYLITLDTSKLPEGRNTIRLNVVTALSPVSTYWSSQVIINVVDKDTSKGDQVHGPNPVIDHSGDTSVKVRLTGASYDDDSVGGTITTVKFHARPGDVHTVDQDSGKKGVEWVDVRAIGFTGGSATITLTYSNGDIASAKIDENTLTLYYYDTATNTWKQMSNIVRDLDANTITGDISIGSLDGTYISMVGSTVSAGPATPPATREPTMNFPAGGGFIITSTTTTTSPSTSTTMRSTTTSTTSKSSTSTSTTTSAAAATVTSTMTSTLQTTITATSTSTAVKSSTATATVITTSVSTATKDVSTVVTAVKKSTVTVTSGVTSTTVTTSTVGSAATTVTENKIVGEQGAIFYAAITLAVASVVAAILLTAKRPKQYVVD